MCFPSMLPLRTTSTRCHTSSPSKLGRGMSASPFRSTALNTTFGAEYHLSGRVDRIRKYNQPVRIFADGRRSDRKAQLAKVIADRPFDESPHLVVPVPVYWLRRLMRKTNTAATVAQAIARQLSLPLELKEAA